MRTALVIGGAECVVRDMLEAKELFRPDRIYAVNDIGAAIERLDVWCTLHPEFMDEWEDERRHRGLPNGYEVVAALPEEVGRHFAAGKNIHRRITYRFPGMTSSGSSGLFATKVALEDGFDRIVLAGVPMLPAEGHWSRMQSWEQCACFTEAWKVSLPFIREKVRSLSGWTAELLGRPTVEWITAGG